MIKLELPIDRILTASPINQGLALLAGIVSLLLSIPDSSAANYGVKRAISVELAHQADPPKITLTWPLRTDLASYTITRTDPSGTTITTELPASATHHTDTSVSSAVPYEYQISARLNGSTQTANSLIAAGFDLPLAPDRGVILLLVDSTVATPLAPEITRLQQDLNGDGWRHETHLIDPLTSTPPEIRNLVIARHSTTPEVSAILLLGKIPVPYSGNHTPDNHAAHRGAWPADCYYGELDATWTDTTVNNSTASRPANRNIPGDGKFDQTFLPSDVDLTVGRIDLSNLPSYAPLTEIDLLRRYLDKNHAYRQATSSTAHCALIDDHLSTYSEGFAAPPRSAFTSILGKANVQDADWNTVACNAPQLFGAGFGFSSYTSITGVTSTTQTATMSPSVTFSLLFGSYFGDWDNPDNVLRAQLGTPSGGLATMHSGRPIWQIQSLGHGKTLGDIALLTLNARYFAPYPTGYAAYRTHITLLGDPTLRLFPAPPPTTPTAVLLPTGTAQITWSAPATQPPGFLGYHVYRCATPNSTPEKQTTTPILTTTFTDPTPLPTGSSYLIKTTVLQQTASSSYTNTSQATFAELQQAQTYSTWSITHFGIPDAPPQADPDGDLQPNLLEYATGNDPNNFDTALQTTRTSNNEISASYNINPLATEAAVQLLTSTDLTTWEITNSSTTAPLAIADGVHQIHLQIPTSPADRKKFLRIQATSL